MATLTGTQIANTYKQLLQVGSGNDGLTASVQTVQDGQGTNSALQLSQSAVNIDGTFQLNGVTLTANASALNNIADLTGATGIIAVSGGNVYGRTLTGGTGVSITNADGTEGNPTIALNPTGVVSASYGPATNIEINSVGQVVSAGAATSVSVSGVTANTFTGGTFAGTTGDFSSNVSVGGNLVIAGQFSPASLSVTGTINATKISATNATFNNVVSAGFFVGDGSGLVNVPSASGGTLKSITAGTGIKLTIDAAVTTTIPVSGTVAVSANQNFGSVSVSTALAVTGSALFGIVSATNIDTDELLIAGVSAATVTEVAAVSALTQTNLDSITSINTVVANVSALTSVNAAAITSINGVIEGNVSADSGTFNTLTVVTSASVGGTFNVGGNVGIGTTSPAVPLHISSATPSIRLTDTDDNSDAQIGAAAGGLLVFDADINNEVAGSAILFRVDGGSEKMRITSTGNVGIGTSSPDRLFEVEEASGDAWMRLRASDTGGGADTIFENLVADNSQNNYIYFGDLDDTNIGMIRYSHASNFMSFTTNTAERLRINSSGNVGINTTSPLAKLHSSVSSSGAALAGGVNVAAFLEAATNTSLQISTGTGSSAYINLGDAADIDATRLASQPGFTQLSASGASDYLRFDAGGFVERMRIDSSGNVGIGTSSPSTKAEISTNNETSILRLTDTATIGAVDRKVGGIEFYQNDASGGAGIGSSIEAYHVNISGDTDLRFSTGDNTERMRIDSSGNVGINTTTTLGAKLFVSQGAAASPATSGNMTTGAVIGSSTAGEALNVGTDANGAWYNAAYANNAGVARIHRWLTGGTERMRINSSGNVLIGTTSDTTDLAYSPKLKLSGSGPVLYLEETDTSQDYSITALGSKFYIRDATAVVPRLTIDSSGNVGIGTASPAKQLHITKASKADIGTLTDGVTITPDFDANQNFSVTLGGNRTLANPTNIDAGQTGSIFVVQDGTGSRTLSFGTYWKFAGGTAPTLSTAAGSVDRIDYIVYTTTAIHAVATLNVS